MPKPFFDYSAQIQKLKDKKMEIPDEAAALDYLHRYGYFALVSGYKSILKNPTTKNYRDGTTFNDLLAIYEFDRDLRELVFRFILLIERHLRSVLSYSFCDIYGESQTEYLNPSNYNTTTAKSRNGVRDLISKYLEPVVLQTSQYGYIEHQKRYYANVPLWALVNALTFGTLSKMYAFSKQSVQAGVSREFKGVNEGQLKQFLEVLTAFRNVCAHNERLFNHICNTHDIPDMVIHKKLNIAKKGNQYLHGKRDLFSVVIAFRYLLTNEDFLEFKNSLSKLIDRAVTENSQVSQTDLLNHMGFPSNWKNITRYKPY